ncbi:MAG: glycine zipper 2TM domain-containing protein [Undibacterium sp.]|nr:glycine zipper 2TM domain-containing protein [Undibacterium sp.]
MKNLTLICAVVAITQLSGCVVHRPYSNSVRSNDGYTTQYPSQYQEPYQQTYQQPYQQPYASQNQPQYTQRYQEQSYQQATSEIAQIVGIRNVAEVRRESGGGGALVGALIGGIIGNQLGRGDEHSSRQYDRRGYGRHHERNDDSAGRAVATVGGAIIGGVIGNEIDHSNTEQRVRTEITLRLENGRNQAVILDNVGQFRIGDRVRVSYQSGRWVIL